MRGAETLTWEDRRRACSNFARRCAGSALLWAVLTAALGALIWLFWPTVLTPKVLRHGGSATAFVQTLWQVEATALALSAAIVTFSFAIFSSSRIAQMGGSLPDFARSSGLLGGIAVGLVAIAACGASLLWMPATARAPKDALDRLHSASAMAAVLLSGAALLLIPIILRRALRAGNRGWLQDQLRHRITAALDGAVATFIKRSYARAIMQEVMDQAQLGRAPLSGPPAPYTAAHPRREGVVVDVRLHKLAALPAAAPGGPRSILINPLAALNALDYDVTQTTELIWFQGEPDSRTVHHIFKVKKATDPPDRADDLDRLHAQGLRAIRDDDELWYREVAKIHRGILLHLIGSWRRFGASPGRAPAEDEVGLRPLTDHLEVQVQQIIARDRDEFARLATDVPLGVGLRALEQGTDGTGLATRMLLSLSRMSLDAAPLSSQATADRVRSAAAEGVFTLLREISSGL